MPGAKGSFYSYVHKKWLFKKPVVAVKRIKQPNGSSSPASTVSDKDREKQFYNTLLHQLSRTRTDLNDTAMSMVAHSEIQLAGRIENIVQQLNEMEAEVREMKAKP